MNNLLEKLHSIKGYIGNTPLYNLSPKKGLFAKIEHYQLGGSIKIRAAFKVMEEAIREGLVNENTEIIESTSGNFGIALAIICQRLGLKFIPVIDPCISIGKKKKLTLFCDKIIQITEKDETGNYLLNRIKYIEDYKKNNPNSFQPDQYKNINSYLAYGNLVEEIKEQISEVDYLFVSVSSGGTITGISKTIKKYFKNINIVAVDIEGSMVFSNEPKIRNLPGIGASKPSDFINMEDIDETIILTEKQIRDGCKMLFNDHSLLAGASSGAVYYAVKKKMKESKKELNYVIIIPDSGEDYLDIIEFKSTKKEIDYEIS